MVVPARVLSLGLGRCSFFLRAVASADYLSAECKRIQLSGKFLDGIYDCVRLTSLTPGAPPRVVIPPLPAGSRWAFLSESNASKHLPGFDVPRFGNKAAGPGVGKLNAG